MTSKAKKVTKTVIDVVLWIFMAFALAVTIFAFIANASGKGYPKVGNKCYLSVQSDSMDGKKEYYATTSWKINYGFKTGDLIVCEVLTAEQKGQLQVGDVVTFWFDKDGDGKQETLNTHRIIQIDTDGKHYITHGDNAPIGTNERILNSDVEAKWTGKSIPKLGGILSFLQSPVGFGCVIILPLALFFGYEIVILIITIKKMKGKKKAVVGISKEEEELIKQRAIEEYLAKQKEENQDNQDKKDK